MQKYMFRMDVSLPYLENNQILNRFSVRYFDDIKTIFSKGSKIKPIYLEQLFDKILWNGRV